MPSGSFSVRIVDPLHPTRRIRITCDTEEECRRRLAEALHTTKAIRAGDEDPRALRRKWSRAAFGAPTVEGLWSTYHSTLRGQWRTKAAQIWRVQLAPAFDKLRAIELTAERMAAWERAELATGRRSPRTILNAWIALRAALRLAMPDRLEVLPWGRWKPQGPPKGHRSREACRTPYELEQLIMACATLDLEAVRAGAVGDLTARVLVAGLTGLRQGEMVALGWDRVHLDTDEPELHVEFSAHEDWHARWSDRPRDPPKGNKVRAVALHVHAAQALRVQRDKLRALGIWRADGPCFPARGGGWRHGSVCIDPAKLRRAVERAELPTDAGKVWVTHSLRHTFATLETRGAWQLTGSVQDAMRATGHSKVETLMGYLHMSGRGRARPFTPELGPAVTGLLGAPTQAPVLGAPAVALALPSPEDAERAREALSAKERERNLSLGQLAALYPTDTPKVVSDLAMARYRKAYAAAVRAGATPEACVQRGQAAKHAFMGAWAKLQRRAALAGKSSEDGNPRPLGSEASER